MAVLPHLAVPCCGAVTRCVWLQVMAQICGEKQLPWEEQGELAAERLEALGVFKGAILQLLNRDATLRPSMQRFYDAANRIFSSRTTIKI